METIITAGIVLIFVVSCGFLVYVFFGKEDD